MENINIACQNCTQTQTLVIDDAIKKYKCKNCNYLLFSIGDKDIAKVENNGFVYVLSNPSMPGLLKIGYTVRDVKQRVAELNSATGVPENFVIEAVYASPTPELHEQEAHLKLKSSRNTSNREFFNLTVDKAVLSLIEICHCEPEYLLREHLGCDIEILTKGFDKFKYKGEQAVSISALQYEIVDWNTELYDIGVKGKISNNKKAELSVAYISIEADDNEGFPLISSHQISIYNIKPGQTKGFKMKVNVEDSRVDLLTEIAFTLTNAFFDD